MFRSKPENMLFVRGKNTYGNTISVFLTNALGLSLALLEGVLVLEFAAHVDGDGCCGGGKCVGFKCRDDCWFQAAK